MISRHRLVGIASVLAATSVLAGCSSSKPALPPTAKVERATISLGVSSTGTVSAATEQNLGFNKGGQLTSVDVKVGDHVTAGQRLATIDPVPARQALSGARAQLRAQEALLGKADDSPVVHDAKNALDQARDVLDAVREQVSQTDNSDAVAIYNAQQQLSADESAASSAQSAMNSACAGGSSANCTSAQASYSAASQRVVADQSALRAAEQKRDTDRASGQVSIENAQMAVTTARNTVDSSRSDRPYNIDQQQALVDAARATVSQAQRDLTNTTLRAPADGTITALNGAVGEYLSPSTGTSALAPGTDAAIPGASGSTSTGSTSLSLTGGVTPARPGGSQFIVLSNIDQLQVVALFNESDAATITPDTQVDVTFDAIPDLDETGTVVSVAPSGTSISGVISYYVTVNLDDRDKRLRAGQTANVSVATDERSNVLTVPNTAIRKVRGQSQVTVLEGDKTRTVTIEPGMVGLDRTEIVSGLREGQQVVLPIRKQIGAAQ